MGSLLNPAKDYLLAGAVKLWFNQNLKRYGQMTHIWINSQNHRIDVELELRGESSPIQLAVTSYELSSEAGETFITLGLLMVAPSYSGLPNANAGVWRSL